MACRGVHFALTAEQASRLMDTPGMDNDGLLAFVEEIEEGPNGEGWDDEWVQETDKSWDAIHRCLTDGQLERGRTPFHKCILGSDNLYEGDDHIMNFLSPEEVKEVAAAIKDIDRHELRRRYDAIDTESYGELSDSDFEYTWSWFPHLRDFFQKAAASNRAMLFTVDQ
ncbi:MAG TPA: YfbM family protein [Gemmataceae bacterium]|jgi:hypothetical protein|nr:YfbM family protein [Gemmataceae bacterium]